jgi:hypothetical protein
MNIGIDFDRVLFDTDRFNKYLKDETGLYHVEEDLYDEKGCYSPEKHAKACGIETEEIFDAMHDLNRFLYNDVDKLRDLKPRHNLFLVTRGQEKFQKQKVKASGAQRLFDQLTVVQGASKDIADIDYLVDDREDEIEAADIPGMVFKRGENTISDVINEIGELS